MPKWKDDYYKSSWYIANLCRNCYVKTFKLKGKGDTNWVEGKLYFFILKEYKMVE